MFQVHDLEFDNLYAIRAQQKLERDYDSPGASSGQRIFRKEELIIQPDVVFNNPKDTADVLILDNIDIRVNAPNEVRPTQRVKLH